jgi:hypothetical protein
LERGLEDVRVGVDYGVGHCAVGLRCFEQQVGDEGRVLERYGEGRGEVVWRSEGIVLLERRKWRWYCGYGFLNSPELLWSSWSCCR